MSKYDGLIIPRSYNDYFPRSAPHEIIEVLENSGEVFPVTSGGTGASTPAAARANLGIVTDNALNEDSENPVQNKVIAKLVPATASENNQLADKNFVNSTVGTNTAIFRGTFNSLAELEAYAGEKTNNDYAFVIDEDSAGNTEYNRYKYDGTAWEYEYTLNNSSFTAEQWAAIQSGITAELVAKIGAELPTPTNVDKLVISARDGDALKWVEIDKGKVGEITTKCTKEEWADKPLAERIALAGSAVDIMDDYDVDFAQYMNDQNELSDFENITLSTDSNNPTVIPYDGFLFVQKQKDQDTRVNINGVLIAETTASSSVIVSVTLSVAVSKGDRVLVTRNSTSFSGATNKARYYKKRDYSKRQ